MTIRCWFATATVVSPSREPESVAPPSGSSAGPADWTRPMDPWAEHAEQGEAAPEDCEFHQPRRAELSAWPGPYFPGRWCSLTHQDRCDLVAGTKPQAPRERPEAGGCRRHEPPCKSESRVMSPAIVCAAALIHAE